jgi:hypothetical protein
MILKSLILNEPYASKVRSGEKKIETRLGKLFTHRGDLAVCSNQGRYAGEEQAGVPYHARRGCLFLRDWRYPSKDIFYKQCFYYGSYQSIFEIEINTELIPQPQITSAIDYATNNTLFNFNL